LGLARSIQQCCGSGMFIPDPDFIHPRSDNNNNKREGKKFIILSQKYGLGIDQVLVYEIQDPVTGIKTYPGKRGLKSTGSRIRNTGGKIINP
jgi:hypothetical protein